MLLIHRELMDVGRGVVSYLALLRLNALQVPGQILEADDYHAQVVHGFLLHGGVHQSVHCLTTAICNVLK